MRRSQVGRRTRAFLGFMRAAALLLSLCPPASAAQSHDAVVRGKVFMQKPFVRHALAAKVREVLNG